MIRWPGTTTYPGRVSYDVPVLLRNPSSAAVAVSSVAVTGPHATDFPLRQNNCPATLAAGASCLVYVGFTPHAPGPRHAALRLTTGAGELTVSLDGQGALGQSDWTIDIDYAETTRTDERFVLTSASIGGPYEFRTQGFGADGTIWQASFDLAGNSTFQSGGHYTYTPDRTGLLMSFSRGNAGCEIDQATVNVSDIAFTGPDNDLDRFRLTMAVHCRSSSPYTVRGTLRFRDRTDRSAPAVVTGVQATRANGQATVSWTNPVDQGLAGVLVRWYPGGNAPGATNAGEFAYYGTGQQVTVPVPATGPVTVALWAVDQAGNVSALTSATVTDPSPAVRTTVRRPSVGQFGHR